MSRTRAGEGGQPFGPGGARADAPTPADVGIVAAMPMEVGYLVDRLRQVRKYHAASLSVIEGELAGKLVAIVTGGPGRDAARRATDLLLVGHRPRWVISAGFAGALDPALERNGLALPEEVVDVDGGSFRVERPGPILGCGVPHTGGRLLTVDQVVLGVAEKQQLHREKGAALVDMESSAVAEVCAQRLVGFLSARIISDDARNDLPREVASLLTKSGSYRVGAALRAIWNRPSSLKDFWKLHEQALESADRLAALLERCIEVLPA